MHAATQLTHAPADRTGAVPRLDRSSVRDRPAASGRLLRQRARPARAHLYASGWTAADWSGCRANPNPLSKAVPGRTALAGELLVVDHPRRFVCFGGCGPVATLDQRGDRWQEYALGQASSTPSPPDARSSTPNSPSQPTLSRRNLPGHRHVYGGRRSRWCATPGATCRPPTLADQEDTWFGPWTTTVRGTWARLGDWRVQESGRT